MTDKNFRVGARVKWTSQAMGYAKEKEGIVKAIVPAGSQPDRTQFEQLYRGAGVGSARDHISYVVLVGKKLYWPIANKLERVTK